MPKSRKRVLQPPPPPPLPPPDKLHPEVLASYPGLAQFQQIARRPRTHFALLPQEIPAEVQEGYRRHRQQQYQRALDGPRLSLLQWRHLEIRRDRPLSTKVYRRYWRREIAAGRIDPRRDDSIIDRANGAEQAAARAAVAQVVATQAQVEATNALDAQIAALTQAMQLLKDSPSAPVRRTPGKPRKSKSKRAPSKERRETLALLAEGYPGVPPAKIPGTPTEINRQLSKRLGRRVRIPAKRIYRAQGRIPGR